MSLRVLLADDHPLFRDGLRFTLERAAEVAVVDEAGDGLEAVRMATEAPSPYDVAVLDVRMPNLDGIEATRQVVATGAKVLVLTMYEDDATVLSAVRAGASGYLVKGADAEQVVSAVTAVADGHAVFGPSLASRVLQAFGGAGGGPDGTGGTAASAGAAAGDPSGLPELSAREAEVLELLAEGLTNNEIGARLFISPITVRNHVSRILVKLQVRDRREAMLRVRRP